MAVILTQVRPGAYYDSVVLMRLQKALAALPGVADAGVVMGTEANKQLLEQSKLLGVEAEQARPEDLVVAVSGQDEPAAQAALARVDELLAHRMTSVSEYRPKSLEAALQMLPQAQWVLVSVPGRYAAGVARNALDRGRNVMLYSDNVAMADQVALKTSAGEKGLLVMGPDCGTAIIAGVGLAFANRVRRGRIGIVGASGTGIQAVSVAIHRLGEGVSQAIGTGTSDLSKAVGAITAGQGLDLLARDPDTKVIVLVGKPPAPAVAASLLETARRTFKPVVVDLIGLTPGQENDGTLHYARTLDDAAARAVSLLSSPPAITGVKEETDLVHSLSFAAGQRYLRGLYSGGTLAYEAQHVLGRALRIYSNAPIDPALRLDSPAVSKGHTIVDLGADEFMVGRLHPMIDNDLRIRRLRQEADDPEVAVILLDVVLGYGSHPDPGRELGPAIASVRARAAEAGRPIEVVCVVVGTDEDPQNYARQVEQLQAAGARVEPNHERAVRYAGEVVKGLDRKAERLVPPPVSPAFRLEPPLPALAVPLPPVSPGALAQPLAVINIGLEGFFESLLAQNAPAIQVEWRPPAGGNEKLMEILERLKTK